MKPQVLRKLVYLLTRFDTGVKSVRQKAKKLGISRVTLWRWSKKPEVQAELAKYLDGEGKALAQQLLEQVANAALAGDKLAFKLYMQVSGYKGDPTAMTMHQLANMGITPERYARAYQEFVVEGRPYRPPSPSPVYVPKPKRVKNPTKDCVPSEKCDGCYLYSSCKKRIAGKRGEL